jgi:hypothetical protein
MLRREWLAWILVAVGLARAALLLANDPLLGYANQFDMVRTSACIGIYPDLPEPARYEASRAAPLPLYRAGAPIEGGCYRSSEVALAALAFKASAALRGGEGPLPLRDVGLAKLALAALAVLAIAWALHAHPLAALAHGLVVALVLCDPVVTLWMSTLYTEFTTLWSLYVAIGAAAALAITARGAWATAPLLLLSLVVLAFSREQFSLLAPVLALLAGPWLWARSRHLAVGAFGMALVAAIVSFALVPRPPEIARANRIDAYLGVIVPAATEPVRALRTLGLPERCANVVGTSYYLRRGEAIEEECPGAYGLSSLAFVKFARDDPALLARALARVLPATQAPSPAYVGVIAGRKAAAIGDLPPWLASPVDALLTRLPIPLYAALLLAAMLAAPFALLGALVLARPADDRPAAPLLLALLLGTTVAYALVTTIFGDGLAEAARHFLPGGLAMVASVVLVATGVPALAARWWAEPKRHRVEIAMAFVAVVAVAAACIHSLRWARAQPLALGVLDEPGGRVVSGDGLALRGWALDPYGVESVQLTLGEQQRTLAFGTQVSEELQPLFPGYPDAMRAMFTAEIPATELALALPQGEGLLRIVVRNRHGVATEVERRRLKLAPG